MNMPKVSTIIVVFNGEQHIERAVRSIMGQTYQDWELVVVDDGSTDATPPILQRLAAEDNRIRVVTNEHNKKLIFTRNRGLEEARGEYVAILDSDDVSYPDRLEKQVKFMDENPGYGLCGALYKKIFPDGKEGLWDFPETDEDIRVRMLLGVTHLNSSVMMRNSVLKAYHLKYDAEYPVSEDYKLFFDISRVSKVYNLQSVLGEYHYHGNQQTKVRGQLMQQCSTKIMYLHFELLGIELGEAEAGVLFKCYNFKFPFAAAELSVLDKLFADFMERNATKRLLVPEKVNAALSKRYFECCYHSVSAAGRAAYKSWAGAVFQRFYDPPVRERLVFWFRQLTQRLK